MKKSILFSMLVMTTMFASAQVELAADLGVNLANWDQNFDNPSDEFPAKSNLRYRLGLRAEMDLMEAIALRTGVYYNAKGGSIDVKEFLNSNNASGYYRFNTSYLEVPLNLAYTYNGITLFGGGFYAVGVSGETKWDFSTGGTISISDSGTQEINFATESDSNTPGIEISNTDYGFNIGAGYKLDKMSIDLQYSKGLKNMNLTDPNNRGYDPETEKVTNSVITISLAYFW